MRILVIGGRSKIGSALLALLARDGHELRALVREREPARSDGAEPVSGDLARPDSLRAAMHGVERVFLLSSPHPDAVRWHRNAIDAAVVSGVRLLVRSSILGADRGSAAEFIDAHARCDRYLARSGLDHVILRPNLFMQNVPDSTVPAIDPGGRFYVNAGDARLSMVDTRDVAAAARVALCEDGHAGAAYDLTGPEALSYADVAQRLTAALGRPVSYAEATDAEVRAALRGAGLDEWFAGALTELYADYRRSGPRGYASQVTGAVRTLTGVAPRTLDALLAEVS